MKYIILNQGYDRHGTWSDGDIIDVNTPEEVDRAAKCVFEAGLFSAEIWSGDPDLDSVKTGVFVMAEAPDEAIHQLLSDATDHGWGHTVTLCRQALAGKDWARRRVTEELLDARELDETEADR